NVCFQTLESFAVKQNTGIPTERAALSGGSLGVRLILARPIANSPRSYKKACMSRSVCSLAIAAICAGAILSSGQVHSSTIETTSAQITTPAAYIYVSQVSNGKGRIEGFVASSNGALSPISGSP